MLYVGPAPPLVRAWKELGHRRAADLAARLVAERISPPAADAVTFVPPDPGRQLRRGRHPAQALACRLGPAWSLDVLPLLVRRHRASRQAGLGRADRARNIRGAFVAACAVPRRVVLVDDVYTTGATAAAAASALRRAGATRVDVVSFARTVR